MKIYFTGSTSNLKKDKDRYKHIIKLINDLGHTNTNYVHSDLNLKQSSVVSKEIHKSNVYDYQISLIDSSDVLLADITTQSITVGYQIDYAINKKIPTIVIYKNKKNFKLPVVLTHTHFGILNVEEYSTPEDIETIIKTCLENVKTGSIKFNFYINLQLHNYLTQRASREGKNKSDILREILEKEMKKDPSL